jgi:hypothetical protein
MDVSSPNFAERRTWNSHPQISFCFFSGPD